MKKRFLILLLLCLSLLLTACGAEQAPSEEAAPPETVRPEENPAETVPPEEDPPAQPEEDPAEDPAPGLPPLEGTPLTEEELVRANDALNYNDPYDTQAQMLSCFFTSEYDDVTKLSLEEFLRYFPGEGGFVEDEDLEEFRALAALPDFPWDEEDLELWGNVPSGLPTPVHRIPRAAVDDALEVRAGITTADLTDTEGVLYLPDYDAYYNFTSDFGPGSFQAAEGARDGDILRLRAKPAPYAEDRSVREAAFREEDGRWLIRSFTRHPVENG